MNSLNGISGTVAEILIIEMVLNGSRYNYVCRTSKLRKK